MNTSIEITELGAIQNELYNLVILKDNDARRKRIDPLRDEIEFIKFQLDEFDAIIVYTTASMQPTSHSLHKSSST